MAAFTQVASGLGDEFEPDQIAEDSYIIADAMLEERAKS